MTPVVDFRFCLVGARSAFPNDTSWLEGLRSAAGGLARVLGRRAVLQVRLEPSTENRAVKTELATRALERIREQDPRHTVRVLLNAPDVDAIRLGYDGVHWREDAIPSRVSNLAPDLFCSASVHSEAALQRAESAGVAFVLYGPIWAPHWKPSSSPVGPDALAALVDHASVPVFALGGVTPERVHTCRMAGAHGVAVASGVLHAPDAVAALQTYVSALGAASFC